MSRKVDIETFSDEVPQNGRQFDEGVREAAISTQLRIQDRRGNFSIEKSLENSQNWATLKVGTPLGSSSITGDDVIIE